MKENLLRNEENIRRDFEEFNMLCDRAKFLLFHHLCTLNMHNFEKHYDYNFFQTFGIEKEILKMSPIEQILAVAFDIFTLKYTDEKINFNMPRYQAEIYCNDNIYKADFVIDNFELKEDGKEFSETRCLKKPIIIECDGFEYHSHKKQMEYDYQRENELKTNGYEIFRFTGSQIYKNPYKCIEIIYKKLKQIVEEKGYE